MEPLVEITSVTVIGNHQMRLTFAHGTVGDVDLSDHVWRGVLEPLADPAYFALVSVDPEAGTVCWPNGVDLAPEPLYEAARLNPSPASAGR